MSEQAVLWVTFIGGILVQLVIAAFVYGKLTQKVVGLSDEIARLDKDQDNQWSKINDSRENIAKIKGKLNLNGA